MQTLQKEQHLKPYIIGMQVNSYADRNKTHVEETANWLFEAVKISSH